jgi:dolichol-phosphate mannosyltransferase
LEDILRIDEVVEKIIRKVMSLTPEFDLLIIDDNSPDGTGTIIKSLRNEFNDRLNLIERPGKLGLGTAYITGFAWALERKYDFIFEMDADFSHPPESVISLIKAAGDSDVVVGSRYMDGGEMNGPLVRRVLSRILNRILNLILGLKVHDCTGGFIALRREVLGSIGEIKAKSGDFSFEIIYKAKKAGYKITEIPFVYQWRIKGKTKTNVVKFGFNYLQSAIELRWHLAIR